LGVRKVRVVLSTWGSRGDVEPLAGLAVRLRELGAEVRVCAPPDEEFAVLLAGVGAPLVPLGPSVRSVVTGVRPPSAADAFRLAAELVAARFDTLAAAAEGCDALVATGLMPAGARSVAENLGIRYVYACVHPFDCRRRTTLRRRGRARRPRRRRPTGCCGTGRPAGERVVRRGTQPPPRGDRPATGGQRP
jgi:vancomycin aglycone glucosyltransferase